MINQPQRQYIKKKYLNEAMKNILDKLKICNERHKSTGAIPDDAIFLMGEYRFYIFLCRGDRKKALSELEHYKEITNEFLNDVMFEGVPISTERDGIIDERRENNIIEVSGYMKIAIENMEVFYRCRIIE